MLGITPTYNGSPQDPDASVCQGFRYIRSSLCQQVLITGQFVRAMIRMFQSLWKSRGKWSRTKSTRALRQVRLVLLRTKPIRLSTPARVAIMLSLGPRRKYANIIRSTLAKLEGFVSSDVQIDGASVLEVCKPPGVGVATGRNKNGLDRARKTSKRD